MMRETDVVRSLRLVAAEAGCVLWRNNSGAYKDDSGRLIRYGLGHDSAKLNEVWKSSDLIGITPMRILPKHVGHMVGVFTAIEAKAEGWVFKPRAGPEAAQLKFLHNVVSMGGIGHFMQHADEFRNMINGVRST